jgi:hypothetical protein
VLLGRIASAERYAIYYDIARDALQRGTLPTLVLPAGRLVLRASNAAYTAEQARTIPPGSAMSVLNRFSGARLDGRPGTGALYVGTVAGVLREHGHYANLPKPASPLQPATAGQALWRPGQPDARSAYLGAQKAGASPGGTHFHLYRTAGTLRFADLRVTALAPLFAQLHASGEARQRYGIAPHQPLDFAIAAASDATDYSASRGLADAVADTAQDTRLIGVCAFSSRADRDDGLVVESHGDPTGGLIFAIFRRDGEVVSELQVAQPKGTFATYGEVMGVLG